MKALSIRQPWAELILRGAKTVEYRSRPTRMVGERFWIYAAGEWPMRPAARREMERATGVWSQDLAMPEAAEGGGPMPSRVQMMLDLLGQILQRDDLPTGVIVGSAVIERVTPPSAGDGLYRWHLAEVRRASELRKPKGHPQPSWFEPFPEAA